MTLDSTPLSTSRSPDGLSWVDGCLGVLLCCLAFLLASTPARNSDLWLHLASGRALLHGESPLGVDPFSSTTNGIFYVHSTWLSDVALFKLNQIRDGKTLVPAKAILATLIAVLFLCFRFKESSVTLLFYLGVAASIAWGPWLTLQPSLASLFCLLLTLYLLERPQLVDEGSAARARKQRWLLVPLFALWANLDGWFVLGPLAVGLYTLGELVRASTTKERREFFTLLLLALAGLAACLCTPYHYRTLAWPTPLGINPAEQAWMRDPLGQDLVVYSFGKRFVSSSIFSSPCAWAYYLLLAVGAASFLLTAKKLRLGRLLAWLALAALSVYQARAIPFFAVAGAALTALNLQEVILHRPRTEVLLRFATTARGMGIMTGLALAVLAWPGWLQPAPYRPRGWDVEPDETMVRMAKRLQQERAKSHFRLDRFALTFTPETAHYLAWFCPSEKGFVDSRWSLFPRAAKDFVRMRNCLLQDSASAQRELVDLLEANHLDRIILYDPDRERTALAYRRLFLDSENWRLSAIEGGAALFIHSTSESTPIAAVFDPRWVAYHPTDDQLAPTSSRPLSPPSWLDPFRLRGDERSADREEAALHVLSFDLQTELGAQQWVLTQVTGLTGSGLGFNPAEAAVTLTLRLDFGLPPSPREPLLLAVRAARRALFAHPDDAQAFQLLGEAYLRLGRHTRESMWQLMLPRLAALRQVQTLTALEQAVSLRPDLDNGHAILAQLYYESDQWDNVLHHLQARLRIADSLVKRGGTAGAAGGERRSALRADVVKMEELVEQAQKVYKANTEEISDPSKVLNRASLAARHRLTRQALELLLASYPAIFGAVGVEMQLNLMLKAGRAYEVRDWLTPQVENLIGFSIFHWVEAQAAAACGDYADADLEMHRLSEVLQNVPFMPGRVVPARSSVALRVGGAFLAHPVPIEGIAGYATALEFQSEAFRPLEPIADLLRQEADWLVLRGLLTLEWGDVKTARSRFRTALDLWVSEEEAAAGGGVDFTSRPIAQRILSAIDDSEKNKEGR